MKIPNFLRHLKFLILCVTLSIPTWGQNTTTAVKVGDHAPQIKLKKMLQTEQIKTVDWEKMKGKVVILEFWATWCGSCMPAISHLNELSETFKEKPVIFLSITDEDDTTITKFLKIKSLNGWIGIDNEGSTPRLFGVSTIPHSFIIDQNGIIVANTKPENITSSIINDLLNGKKINLPIYENVIADFEWGKNTKEDQEEPLYQSIIKPSKASSGGIHIGKGEITADGAPLLRMVLDAYQTSYFRAISKLPESENFYKVSIIAPKGKEDSKFTMYQSALGVTFGIKVHKDTVMRDVYVLTRLKDKPALMPSLSDKPKVPAQLGRNRIHAGGQPMSVLADQLENVLFRTVVDETGLTAEYDWDLVLSRADKNILINNVRDQLGLELIQSTRPVEMLIIENDGTSKLN
jgi:uncharacterized protein (TIGR03435 family)